ncbi:amino acid permease 3-like [Juglans regia]|uniref:Amino acid permease 3-like n=1 Tax=Juglans regia TaxID=51240 RepID=A0A6P9EVQ5_JUGRE|nr:amino acid permease 3-like [Juglans regia]
MAMGTQAPSHDKNSRDSGESIKMHQIQNTDTNHQLSDEDLLSRGCGDSESIDDDGRRPKRAGTVWTASVFVTMASVASPLFLSLPGNVAQLGWVAGPAVIIFFSLVTYCTSALLCACYRSPVTAKRNHTYTDAIQSNLDGAKVKICWVIQYLNLLGAASEYTVFASLMMSPVARDINWLSNSCRNAAGACYVNHMPYFMAFAVAQIILFQIPSKFSRLRSFSILCLMMFLLYSGIGVGLAIAKVAGVHGIYHYTDLPLTDSNNTMTRAQNILKIVQAIGDIAHAYDFSAVLIEIEDTVKSPPSEAETMKKATGLSLILTTFVSMLHGCFHFAAFGNKSRPVFLLHGFYKPYWLLDMIASAAFVIQFSGGYQIYLLPILAMVEETLAKRFPDNEFIAKDIKIPTGCRHFGPYKLNLFRLVWRTLFVITTTVLSMFLAIYLDLLKLFQILAFWPITVYFPVEIYMVQKEIPKWSKRWICLQILSVGCLIVTIATAAASSVDLFN